MGELLGMPLTRYPTGVSENPSLIDYTLCGTCIMDGIFSFSVLPFTGLSDHCCISTNIRTNILQQNSENNENDNSDINDGKINTVKIRYTYNENRKIIFKENLGKDKNLEIINKILNQSEVDTKQLDKSISQLNEIILNAARKSFPCRKTPNRNKTAKKSKTKKWFNKECEMHRKLLRKHSRDLSAHPFDRHKKNIL